MGRLTEWSLDDGRVGKGTKREWRMCRNEVRTGRRGGRGFLYEEWRGSGKGSKGIEGRNGFGYGDGGGKGK